jgi:uncharacterized damage-inducible protein DinB
VLAFAQEEARHFNHNYIGPEHILLGIIRESDSSAVRILRALGVDPQRARAELEASIGWGTASAGDELGLTQHSKRVIELAVNEAHQLNHHRIGTEHLLLGILRDESSVAARVLQNFGLSAEQVRDGIAKVSGKGSPEAYALSGAEEPVRAQLQTTFGPLDMLHTLYDYSIWARDTLLTAIEKLDEAQLRRSDFKGVYGSIHDTLVHMAASEWMWLQRCMGDSPLRVPKGEDFADLRAIIDWWNEVHAQAVHFLSVVTEEQLNEEVTYMAPDGKQRTRRVWHMLLHVVNHQTEHRAQIASILDQLGVPVSPTDLVVYLSEREAGGR